MTFLSSQFSQVLKQQSRGIGLKLSIMTTFFVQWNHSCLISERDRWIDRQIERETEREREKERERGERERVYQVDAVVENDRHENERKPFDVFRNPIQAGRFISVKKGRVNLWTPAGILKNQGWIKRTAEGFTELRVETVQLSFQ